MKFHSFQLTTLALAAALACSNSLATEYHIRVSSPGVRPVAPSLTAPTYGAFADLSRSVGASFTLAPPTSDSPAPFTFTSSDPTVASISSGGAVQVLKLGTTTVTASQAATESFTAGSASMTLTAVPPPHVYAQWDPAATGTSYSLSGLTTIYINTSKGSARASVPLNPGKWYWEVSRDSIATNQYVGIVMSTVDTKNGAIWGASPTDTRYRGAYGAYGGFGSATPPNVVNRQFASSAGDTLGFAFDQSTGTFSIYENCSATPYAVWSGLTGTWYPVVGAGGGTGGQSTTANFGATPFRCTPPAGYNAGLWSQ